MARWQDQLLVGPGGVGAAEVGSRVSVLERPRRVAERGTKATLSVRELWFCSKRRGHKCPSSLRIAAAPGRKSCDVLTSFDFLFLRPECNMVRAQAPGTGSPEKKFQL